MTYTMVTRSVYDHRIPNVHQLHDALCRQAYDLQIRVILHQATSSTKAVLLSIMTHLVKIQWLLFNEVPLKYLKHFCHACQASAC